MFELLHIIYFLMFMLFLCAGVFVQFQCIFAGEWDQVILLFFCIDIPIIMLYFIVQKHRYGLTIRKKMDQVLDAWTLSDIRLWKNLYMVSLRHGHPDCQYTQADIKLMDEYLSWVSSGRPGISHD